MTGPADHTGWLRADPGGMVIITTRNKDPRTWGPGLTLRELAPLDDAAAAKMLADLAPAVPDPRGQHARDLGRRLGGLPLALHLAGSYLGSPFARWRTFADYHHALDGVELPAALADLDDPAADARATIQRTWDLSLDALAADDHAEARPLLLLLSCYAPATPIPASMLAAAGMDVRDIDAERERRLRSNLRALAVAGLIDTTDGDVPAVIVHPVVADANRARLRTTGQARLPEIGEAAVRQVLDGDHPLTILTARGLAQVMALQRRHSEAERLCRQVLTRQQLLGDNHRSTLETRHLLGKVIADQNRYAEAEPLLRQVLTERERVLGKEHPDTQATRQELDRITTRQRNATSLSHVDR